MIRILSKTLASGAALFALCSAQVATAQQANCVNSEDVSDAVVNVMPSIISALQTKCSGELAPDGYLAMEGDALSARYDGMAEETWPGTLSFMQTFAERRGSKDGETKEIGAMIAAMPMDAARPFIAALVTAELSKEIKTKDCGKIERGLSLMAPLPPENMGGLVAFIVEMADVKNPSICTNED